MPKGALYTAGAIFAVGAVAHVVRLATAFEIIIGGIVVPVWVSFPGALIAALLAVWMVVAARRSEATRIGASKQVDIKALWYKLTTQSMAGYGT